RDRGRGRDARGRRRLAARAALGRDAAPVGTARGLIMNRARRRALVLLALALALAGLAQCSSGSRSGSPPTSSTAHSSPTRSPTSAAGAQSSDRKSVV